MIRKHYVIGLYNWYNISMNKVIEKINNKADDIIKDNTFLFAAFENRLLIRLKGIFDKYKIPMNKDIIKKNLEENLINNCIYGINHDRLP